MYDKQVRQQRGCHAEKRDKRKFNCGTSYRWVTITISENLCEACIIQENQISLTEEGASDVSEDMELAPTTGQAIKSARGMPWHQEPTKDVTSCDKLRGGANIH